MLRGHAGVVFEAGQPRPIPSGRAIAMSLRPGAATTSMDIVCDQDSQGPNAQQAGNPSFGRRALETLYRSQAGRLLRLFNRRSDPQDAADLVHETFTRFASAVLERDATPECPESYLTQVAVNVLNDRGRDPVRRAALYAVPVDDVALPALDELAAHEARDMLNRVEGVMMMLKPLTRDIFIARRFHGYSRAEIAAQTGLSVKAVDKHLGRAVVHLHRHFGVDDAN
jgi:RNA polymerase sigma-70 factor (ECF subfamily)